MALAMRVRSLADLGNNTEARDSFTEAKTIFETTKALKHDDPEAGVIANWLNALPTSA